MPPSLIAWARAVKARQRPPHPVLWLFTDPIRLPDPTAIAATLPPRLCGIVLRDPSPALAAALAKLCRRRHIALAIAGNPRLAARHHAGQHLRRGRAQPFATCKFCTASAHTAAELRRGLRTATLVFLSPVFPTASHPGAPALGPTRWAALARARPVLALGGITPETARALPRWCRGIGCIGALAVAHPTQPTASTPPPPTPRLQPPSA